MEQCNMRSFTTFTTIPFKITFTIIRPNSSVFSYTVVRKIRNSNESDYCFTFFHTFYLNNMHDV
nr:MAG TPA: hypothetical protein [Crassvirales sp.]